MKYYTSWGKSLEHVILNEKKRTATPPSPAVARRRPPSPAVARRRPPSPAVARRRY